MEDSNGDHNIADHDSCCCLADSSRDHDIAVGDSCLAGRDLRDVRIHVRTDRCPLDTL